MTQSGQGVVIRSIVPSEYESWTQHATRAFGGTPDVARIERNRPFIRTEETTAAFDGSEIVGTAHHEPSQIALPGGRRLACTGVTRVSVAATHRRRGILRAMMTHQLEQIRSDGLPLAALWASESPIYGRFGYGLATVHESWRIEQEHTAMGWWTRAPRGSVRFVPTEAARRVVEPLFERLAECRPGSMTRLGYRWDAHLGDHESDRGGLSPLNVVVHETDGEHDGYAAYRLRSIWERSIPAYELHVRELVALSPEAEVALWHYLFGVDLVHVIEADNQPTDATLPWVLADFRRLQRQAQDGLWIRVIDIPAAFEARAYPHEGRLVIEVDDPILPDCGGRFLIEALPEGARVTRTKEPSELDARPAALATLLFGTQHASVLGRAGMIDERSPGALRRADELFRWPTAPHCLYHF